MRRIAFFFSMRRCSLLETNQRLRRTVLRTPLFTTFLRKRLSRESWDSPFRKFTDAKTSHLLSAWKVPRKENRPICRLGRGGLNFKKETTKWSLDQPVRFTLLFCKIWTHAKRVHQPNLQWVLYTIHTKMKSVWEMLKRKAPWHGLDSTARKNPSNDDYYTPKNVQGGIAKKPLPENLSDWDLFRKPRLYCTVTSAM